MDEIRRENAAKIAIVAALPQEIAALVRGARADPALLKRGIRLHRIEGAVVAAAGMGAARVSLALEAALREEGVEVIVSAGLAGACSSEIGAGDVMEPSLVIDAKTGERFRCDAATDGQRVLVTTDAIAGVKEKLRLREAYGAALVDMEAATVARLARARGLRFRAIKGVSDAHDFEIEAISRFADPRGQFRAGAFAVHTALRPWSWGAAMRLGRESNRALTRIWTELHAIIAAEGQQR